MSRVKVKLADNIARVIFIEKDATIGAKIGTDLLMPDGTLATAATLRDYLGVSESSGSGGVQDHKLLRGLTVGDDHTQYTRKDTLTTRGDLYARGASTVGRLGIGTNRQLLRSNGTDPEWFGNRYPRGAVWLNPAGDAIEVPVTEVVGPRIVQDCTIKKVSVFTQGGTGSCVLDVRKDSYANFPPTGGDSICASAKPTIAAGIKYEDSTLTGWTTSLSAGDVLSFVIESTSVFTYIYIQLDLEG